MLFHVSNIFVGKPSEQLGSLRYFAQGAQSLEQSCPAGPAHYGPAPTLFPLPLPPILAFLCVLAFR